VGFKDLCFPTSAHPASYDTHHVVASPADAARLALNSGVDMQFYDFDHATFQNAIMRNKNGQVSETTLDALSREFFA